VSTESDGADSSLVLSSRSAEASRVVELASAAPDIRTAEVDRARADIDEGRFKPDSMAIAESMVSEIF
jgi:flagellar biosynthesis anti-sigma factor FlgM